MSALAHDLWRARRFGTTISVTRQDLPRTKDGAYRVQDTIIQISGMPTCGFKVGSTSLEAQRLLGADEPGMAVLLAPFVQESPCRVTLAPEQMPAVEGEFAFRFGRDLPLRAQGYTMTEVVSAIDSVAGAVEVVGTRFSGGLPGKGRYLTTADCGVNIALALGSWSDFSGEDFRDHHVAMAINGDPAGSGTGSRALGSPLNVLLWLVNHLSDRRREVRAGDLVATGTCTGLDPIGAGDSIRADFGPLGVIAIDFD